MFISELRAATMSAHQQLDKMLIPYIKSTATPAQYAGLLKCFYGYFNPVEDKIATQLNDGKVPAFSQRRKSGVIVDEIKDAGIDTALPVATDLPEINNMAQAFGSMYVLEGSTLGGKIISKIIAGNMQKDPADIRFFNFYGDDTEALWGSFVGALNTYADTLDETAKAQMIKAAQDTFSHFGQWIQSSFIAPAVAPATGQ